MLCYQLLYMAKYLLPTGNSHNNDMYNILLKTDTETPTELFLFVKCNQSATPETGILRKGAQLIEE